METLVIEDDAVRRRLLEKVLEQRGHTVVAHSNVETALGAHERAPFPLVLTSRRLANDDGLEVCRRVRALSSPSTFVMVLAWDDEATDAEAVLAAGADDYFTAPTRLDLLALRLAFATRQLERAWSAAVTVRTAMAALDEARATSEATRATLQRTRRLLSSPWDDVTEGIPMGLPHIERTEDADGIPCGLEQTPPECVRGHADADDDDGGIPTGFEHVPHPDSLVDGLPIGLEAATPGVRGAPEPAPPPASPTSVAAGEPTAAHADPPAAEVGGQRGRIRFDLRGLVDEAVGALQPEATRKGIDLTVRHALAAPRHVLGDAHRIRQILLHLVGNAVEATNRGQVLINVRSEERNATDARFRITVADNGPGLPEDRLARLLHGPATATASMCGLAASKRLVEAMDGRIGATSKPGAGSTFWFTVQLELTEAPTIARPATALGPVGQNLPGAQPARAHEPRQPLRSGPVDQGPPATCR